MASCITTQWGNAYSPQVRLTVIESASTGNTSTLSWTLEYLTKGYAAETVSARPYSVTIAGETVKSGTYDINGKDASAYTIATGTKVINKTTSSQTISFSLSFEFHVTWSGTYTGVKTASGSISVAAKTTYTVSYNANGGTGAPSSQTKWYGTALTLSSSKPTRTGYTFQGWATSASGSVAYAAGASYTANANATLYAVWKALTYTVSYNANGGTGAPSNQTKTYGKTLTLSSTKPTRTNYTFKGWAESATATTATYSAGGSYTANKGTTLYAVWELAYVKPRIYSQSFKRCDSNGTAVDDGTSALISFSWECDLAVSSIDIEWKSPEDTLWAVETISASGTSGSVSQIIGSGELDAESSYDVRITVADDNGESYVTGIIPTIILVIDALKGGKGVAFGKVAELENTADFAFDAKFNGSVYGNVLGLNVLPAIPAGSDLNDYMSTGSWAIRSNAIASTITCGGVLLGTDSSVPPARACRFEVSSSTGAGIRSEQWSYLRQRFIPYNDANPTWERDIARGADNVWRYYDWWKSSLSPTAAQKVYHSQKLLWGGDLTSGMYMTSGHTANLTEAVSAQPSGIVLVFCAYNGADDTNWGWQSFFVPKQLVALSSSVHTFTLSRGNFSYTGTKYLYISDTYITGHDNNTLTGTASGITYANNKFVLRYVIGV